MASANRCFCHHLPRCVNMPKPFPVSLNEDHMFSVVATQPCQRGSIDPCHTSMLLPVLNWSIYPTYLLMESNAVQKRGIHFSWGFILVASEEVVDLSSFSQSGSLFSHTCCSVSSPQSRSLFPYSASLQSAVVGEAAQPVCACLQMAFLHTALAIILVCVFKYSK